MRRSIGCYKFSWTEMTAPQQDIVLRSLQVMVFRVKNSGKVLVYCYAGLGRTELMAAFYLVYSQHMPSEEAIKLARQATPRDIQSSSQGKFICYFERHLWRLAQTFRVVVSDAIVDIELFFFFCNNNVWCCTGERRTVTILSL
ncbi:putative phosphatase [Trypanosoma rangeli]|uniref:protein-tyrosine-phosphatase n=1 Tax=Trypanosoma rangeli TaxID=5698 RepID=A0A422NJI5_TRYRA|nr:putative phosphatase [Trypanosoma rangeli]RNF05640.1 putative phosphatase [Trypanosoma rangeli]|eukprot:RNF05640.1 putative phosphatase [Trypanosoma rangeli]